MPFKDILVALNSYPDPTPVSVVEDAVAVAAALGAHLAAVSCETHVQLPGHFVSAAIVDGMIAGEAARRVGRARRACWPRSMRRRKKPASFTKPSSRNA